MAELSLEVAHESWPIAGEFTISRGSKTTAEVVTVTLDKDGIIGRGECVPYARYDESIGDVVAALEAAREQIESGLDRKNIPAIIEPRAARNALDCALWDLEAKCAGKAVWQVAGVTEWQPLTTAFTLGLDTPDKMARAAADAQTSGRPLLKLKLGRDGDKDRLLAIRAAAPSARLIVDANEGWAPDDLAQMLAICKQAGVELVEQPLPAANDAILAGFVHDVPVCADESAHDRSSLAHLLGKYDMINIKLDKTGGLTEALAFADAARQAGLGIMCGCMLATSLAMAPAMLVAQGASVVDLDGPLLLARDRDPGIRFEGCTMYPPPPALWG